MVYKSVKIYSLWYKKKIGGENNDGIVCENYTFLSFCIATDYLSKFWLNVKKMCLKRKTSEQKQINKQSLADIRQR